jgi:hypothetical protein
MDDRVKKSEKKNGVMTLSVEEHELSGDTL